MNFTPDSTMDVMLQQHWGDLPLIPDTESGIAAIEREQITKPRPVEVEGAKLHQPTPLKPPPSHELPPEYSSVDALTLHTIRLVQHSKKIRSLLQTAQQQQENTKGDGDGTSNLAPPPSIPELPDCILKYRRPGDISGKDSRSDFVLGRGKAPPELSYHTVRQILKKSISAICAHAGFDSSTDVVLDVFTDVVHEYNRRICRLLRVSVDREALTGHTGFVDVMEQTFHEAGLGSITSLHTFYQTKIMGYHSYMMRTCQHLTEEYEKLRIPEAKPTEDVKTVKVKEEPVPEIHFPIMEETEEAPSEPVQIPLHLEELQGALQHMEHDASSTLKDEESMKWPPGQGTKKENATQNPTPNLDPDEEIHVSDSPTPSTGDTDITQSIPSVAVSDSLSPGIENSRMGKPPKKKKKKLQ